MVLLRSTHSTKLKKEEILEDTYDIHVIAHICDKLSFNILFNVEMAHARVPSPKHECHTFQFCQHLNRFAKLYSKICQSFHRSVLVQTGFFTYSKPLCCAMLSLRPFSTLFKFVKAFFWSALNKKPDHLL